MPPIPQMYEYDCRHAITSGDQPVGVPELLSRIHSAPSQFFLDPQQLVVLGQALRSARCASLDLSRSQSDHEVSDEGILGLA